MMVLVGTGILICMGEQDREAIWIDLNRHHIRNVQLHYVWLNLDNMVAPNYAPQTPLELG